MSKPKLFVALPTSHGVMPSGFLSGILELVTIKDVELTIIQTVNCYVNLARNEAAANFLSTDCTHLMFIDADIVFNAWHVKRLLSHDVDIVGGLIPKKKQGDIELVCNALPDRPHQDNRGLMKLRHVSTGFMLIKRGVLTRMRHVYGEKIQYREYQTEQQLWDFFPMGIVDKRYLVEDWYFCDNARDLGFTVYGDMEVQLGHIGSVVFPLESQIEQHKERHAA